MVNQFMQKCKKDQPEKFQEVCDKYQTIDNRKWRIIRQRERCAGLLGLQPAAISVDVANATRLESSLVRESE